MIDVTALIEGTGSTPQWACHWRRASAMGSKFSGRRKSLSEDRGFGVRAPDLLQRLDHLALGGARAGAVEQPRHEVLLRRRRAAQLGQRALHARPVAARPRGLQPADLLALQRRVDVQDRRLAVVALGVAVDADHDLLAGVDALLQLERRVGDLPLRVVALDRL